MILNLSIFFLEATITLIAEINVISIFNGSLQK